MTKRISAKELIRRAFKNGNYDVTHSKEEVEHFCRIFAGEEIAMRAIEAATFLTPQEAFEMRRIARGLDL